MNNEGFSEFLVKRCPMDEKTSLIEFERVPGFSKSSHSTCCFMRNIFTICMLLTFKNCNCVHIHEKHILGASILSFLMARGTML